jgi:hypothetical protein
MCPYYMLEHVTGYIPKSGIAGSSGSTVPNFLRNRQTDFQNGGTLFLLLKALPKYVDSPVSL